MEFFELKQAVPLAQGSTRIVYPHPSDPALLIKVMHPHVLARHRSTRAWYKRLRRDRVAKVFVREIREQLILAARGEDIGRFLQRVTGFCETDLGMGMIVEAIRGPDGKPAPSLKALVQEGRFGAAEERALEIFCTAVRESDIVVSALNALNILYAADARGDRRFILIDGHGDRAFIPVKNMFPFLNASVKKTQIGDLHRQIERLAAARGDSLAVPPAQRPISG